MDVQQTVLDILQEMTGEDFSDRLDEELFDSGILDSMATVQMLLELQEQCEIQVPVSEFERSDWNTPSKIVTQVESLRNE